MDATTSTTPSSSDVAAADDDGEIATLSSPFTLLPDEVLEFVLSLLSPYADLRNTSLVSKRFLRCSRAVMAHKSREFGRCVQEMSLVWQSSQGGCCSVAGEVIHKSEETASASFSPSGKSPAAAIEISKRYSHSAAYDDETLAMYVFGGCTSTSTTFNDLWRLDLNDRRWTRPMATGTYPSPKACAVMVLHKESHSLVLFGGWTHPSLYPLHQSWRLFNELHQYDITLSRWTHLQPSSSVKPPAMAGHSATIHGESMVVFGGLHKQRSSIGQFSSSNDIWCFNLTTHCWQQRDIPEPRPTPRYGQSQLFLDDNHLLILGGCGGPNNIYTDVWLLAMDVPHWRWIKCEIANADHGASHMWCHPAVKVDDFAIILGKNRSGGPKTKKVLSESETAQFNVIPQLRRGMNRGYGSIIRRQNASPAAAAAADPPSSPDLDRIRRLSSSSDASGGEMDTSPPPADDDEEDDRQDISVEPVMGDFPSSPPKAEPVFKTSVTLKVNQQQQQRQQDPFENPVPSTSRQLHLHGNMNRMQAFATGPPTYTPSSSSSSSAFNSPSSSGNSNLGAVPKNVNKQMETRQKQLNSLKKMEEKLKSMGKMESSGSSSSSPPATKSAPATNSKCMCHRLSMYVLDISGAMDRHVVTWMNLKTNASLEAPEETILYTLVKGRAELIMFGGIQKDVSSMTSRAQPTNSNDSVSNSTYYLNIPRCIV